jgi:hypothetical protein
MPDKLERLTAGREIPTGPGNAENWRRAADPRAFVESVGVASQASHFVARDTLERWAAWVFGVADRIDPIRAGRIPGQNTERVG